MNKNEKKLVNLQSRTDQIDLNMVNKEVFSLTDSEIVEGLKQKDCRVTREYFYKYCRIAYAIYNKKYDLERKLGLDFYSIAHEYYLSLDRHGFSQLDDRDPSVSLKTWMVNGFRFVLLDRLKIYSKELVFESIDERVGKSNLQFDIADDDFKREVHNMVEEICSSFFRHDHCSFIITKMLLVEGFKTKDVAEQLGMTPSAVSQRYHKILDQIIVPYFQQNYDGICEAPKGIECVSENNYFDLSQMVQSDVETVNKKGRVTPDNITTLKPNDVYVIDSHLTGTEGQNYAIPTMQGGVRTIRPYVNKFINYAKKHPERRFLVTRIGCGISGFSANEIAPLFSKVKYIENISLPEDFWKEIE